MKEPKISLLLMIPILWIIAINAQSTEPEDFDAQSVKTPSDQLKSEHQLILTVIDETKKETAALRGKTDIDEQRIRQMVDFYTHFADRYHHAKEERFYFPSILYSDFEAFSSLIERLTAEHLYGRSIMEEIRYAMDNKLATPDFIAERLEKYTTLMEKHIERENRLIFPEVDRRITGAEEKAILVGFEKIEKEELGSGFHEKYHRIATELAEKEK